MGRGSVTPGWGGFGPIWPPSSGSLAGLFCSAHMAPPTHFPRKDVTYLVCCPMLQAAQGTLGVCHQGFLNT